ncbi:hypothetical protein JQ038_13255 [Clostridium botulinum]|nr:hypothetical protein [Clostridium botulinum]MCS4471350.1 hypothetical protein [Clostridium botulinum]MCS4472566.1 hypothetical protein [Clostridium botulinum]MCS4476981.1 hypothetical protein [Clostridium botulinum]MCS4478504.1 hypothetical protein [Clostridium botulinum]
MDELIVQYMKCEFK